MSVAAVTLAWISSISHIPHILRLRLALSTKGVYIEILQFEVFADFLELYLLKFPKLEAPSVRNIYN